MVAFLQDVFEKLIFEKKNQQTTKKKPQFSQNVSLCFMSYYNMNENKKKIHPTSLKCEWTGRLLRVENFNRYKKINNMKAI